MSILFLSGFTVTRIATSQISIGLTANFSLVLTLNVDQTLLFLIKYYILGVVSQDKFYPTTYGMELFNQL